MAGVIWPRWKALLHALFGVLGAAPGGAADLAGIVQRVQAAVVEFAVGADCFRQQRDFRLEGMERQGDQTANFFRAPALRADFTGERRIGILP